MFDMEKRSIERILMLSNDLRWQIGEDFHDNLAEGIYADAAEIAHDAVIEGKNKRRKAGRK